ncbi:low temperature requirement protein LtrA [Aeromicrobium sp. SORGH_AS981]|uniref:low temperature requirement protein A n=1 Tax=Aeromicrobium sp. SORGH_AS_0981 TaxID=3041802 RepID=UPI00286325C6|nr:low temperature requirement protein A [Aeromicrobium sp. SORGH_AS_0981]MDR6118367.1 low temperature requirement protein LtrA [Aeromicrobium sp. SORGH_AS_0981]
MSTSTAPSRLRLLPMRPRDPGEDGRVASTLELFFDLVFVVAVSVASVQLHHQLTEDHVVDGLVSYAMVFFAIWWAWMNFTWFATSFAVDDWLYRVLTFVQMAGVLVLAAGIQPVFEDDDLRLVIVGYVIMRVAMVAQWLRAARADETTRRTCLTYAAGISLVQVLWIAVLVLPGAAVPVAFVVLLLAELAVPVVAERRETTPWHPHHVTERYALFTLILLGESLLGSANAVLEALHDDTALVPLLSVALLAFVTTAALWWIYFWPPHHRAITSLASSLRYGYVHYVVFAAAGALSAGIEVEIDVLTDHSELTDVAAAFTVTVPVALFVLGIWWITLRDNADAVVNTVVPVGALLVLLDPVLPIPFALTSVVLALVVAVLVVRPPTTPAHG